MAHSPETKTYGVPLREVKHRVLLDAVAATTTSDEIDVGKYERISLQFVAASISSGNGAFTVSVSNDATNWDVYERIITNVTAGTVVNSLTLSSNSNQIVFINNNDAFRYIKVTVTRTTDGSYSAILCAQT